jgi:hypothetical protein
MPSTLEKFTVYFVGSLLFIITAAGAIFVYSNFGPVVGTIFAASVTAAACVATDFIENKYLGITSTLS